MSWLITAHYRPGGAQDRLPIRDAHLAYLAAHKATLLYGGALLDDAQPPGVLGMFIAIDVASRQQAEAFVRDEPYHRAGLCGTVILQRLQQFVPHEDPDFLQNELTRERARLARPA